MVLMACIAVVVLSQIGLQRLPRDLFPQITIPVVSVQTTYNGASPETMERTVTYPLEQAVTRVAGVTQILSTTRQGFSNIQIWFGWGSNLDVAEIEVIQNVQRALRNLPTGVSQPFVLKFDISNIPVVQVVVGGGGLDARQLYDLAYNTIEPQLERIPGVAHGFGNGGRGPRQRRRPAYRRSTRTTRGAPPATSTARRARTPARRPGSAPAAARWCCR